MALFGVDLDLSLADALRNFLSSINPAERPKLNLRSCEACSFHKVLNRTHYCTQVQPASTINNVYDAQLCIYYTPETAMVTTSGLQEKIDLRTQPLVVNENQIRNSLFETRTFKDWTCLDTDAKIVEVADLFSTSLARNVLGNYACEFKNGEVLQQALFPLYADEIVFYWWFKDTKQVNPMIELVFVDGTSEEDHSIIAPTANTWKFCFYASTTHKLVAYVNFCAYDSTTGEKTTIAFPQCFRNNRIIGSASVTQATRTSLKVQPEREDLLLKDLDLSASGSLQNVLTAVAGEKHKVYAFGFEADADGVYYFSATVGGSAFKFARRLTSGIYGQTLMHPVVCDTNTALQFMSTTGNTKLWIQYKTEA